MIRARFGYALGPANQPWPLWLLLAIPIGVTLLWLALATLAIVATYRQWQRQQQSAQQMDLAHQSAPVDQAD